MCECAKCNTFLYPALFFAIKILFKMAKLLILVLAFSPVFAIGQNTSYFVRNIDSVVYFIENDPTLVKKAYDTVAYLKEDGGENWDSAYHHKDIYYKDGQIVKIIAWNKYGNWRNDMLAYYQKDKTIKFAKGESFKHEDGYGNLN